MSNRIPSQTPLIRNSEGAIESVHINGVSDVLGGVNLGKMQGLPFPPPGGGGTAIYGLYMICRCEGYGFQAVYSRIGYINQSVWV